MEFDGFTVKKKRVEEDEDDSSVLKKKRVDDSSDAKGCVISDIRSSPEKLEEKSTEGCVISDSRSSAEKFEENSTDSSNDEGCVISDSRSSPEKLEENSTEYTPGSDMSSPDSNYIEEEEKLLADLYKDQAFEPNSDEDEDSDGDQDTDCEEDIYSIEETEPDKLFQQSFWDSKEESLWWPPPHRRLSEWLPDHEVEKYANLILPCKIRPKEKSDPVNVHSLNAIERYNRVNGVEYDLVEVVDAKRRLVAGFVYYITFTARNTKGGDGSLKRFQACAYEGGIGHDSSVTFCRLEREEDPGKKQGRIFGWC